MNIIILISGGFLAYILITAIAESLRKNKEVEAKLLEERNNVAKRREAIRAETTQEKKARQKSEKEYWGGVYHNKAMDVIRVSERQKSKLFCDAEFLVNASGSYKNIVGVYRGKKVMNKFARKAKNASSNQKSKKGTNNK